MVVAWNGCIQKVFIQSCISCLDGSMSGWIINLKIRLFFYPHKSQQCCNESGIMFGWKIFEVRDHHILMWRPQLGTSTNMKNVGIMLLLTRDMWSNGKAVIMNSGLCVLKGLVVMRSMVVCGSVLIKRGYTGLRGFMETVLTITSSKKMLGM